MILSTPRQKVHTRSSRRNGPQTRPNASYTKCVTAYKVCPVRRRPVRALFAGSERVRLARSGRAARLILGSHEDLAPCFRREGLRLQTVSLQQPAPEDLAAMLEKRLAFFARREDRARFEADSVAFLAETFRGDLRRMEYFLYEFFQEARPAGAIRAGPLQKALEGFTPPSVEARDRTRPSG
jgi:hypothetical protein